MPGEADSPVEEGERDGAPVAAAVDDGPAASIEPAAADRSEGAQSASEMSGGCSNTASLPAFRVDEGADDREDCRAPQSAGRARAGPSGSSGMAPSPERSAAAADDIGPEPSQLAGAAGSDSEQLEAILKREITARIAIMFVIGASCGRSPPGEAASPRR